MFLAFVTAFAAATPALPAYAVEYEEESVIQFDPGIGPDLSRSNNGYERLPQREEGGRKISYAKGKAGRALTESADFQGIATQKAQHANGGDTKPRPVLPSFDEEQIKREWPGYKLQGWFDGDKPLINLPAEFDYTTPTTYTAKWIGDDQNPFTFTIMHYRDRNGERNQKTDGSAIAPKDANDIFAFKMTGPWERQAMVNEKVSSTSLRSIPGYMLQDVLIKNNRKRRFGEPSGQGTITPDAATLGSNQNVTGNMPNDDLTVAYRYKPDPDKTFVLRTEYVNVDTGMQIKPAESKKYTAEAVISGEKKNIEAYVFDSAELGAGNVSDSARGVYSADEAGLKLDGRTGALSGNMPNQPVTVRYRYRPDPNFKSQVIVNYYDENNNLMTDIATDGTKILRLSFGENRVDIPKIGGYLYPPNIHTEPSANFANQTPPSEADQNFKFTLANSGGTVDVHYVKDENDSTYWAKVTPGVWEGGRFGVLNGITGGRTFKKGTHKLSDLLQGVQADPFPHYRLKGWYKADAAGRPTGEALSETVNVDGNLTILAVFMEAEGEWFDLRFEAGENGRLEGKTHAHVSRSTIWQDLQLPHAVPNDPAAYMFDKWYNESGDPVTNFNMQIAADQTYTARFIRINAQDDGILSVPDVSSEVASNGSGVVRVNGANGDRNYAVTDKDGNVIAVKKGVSLERGAFTDLPVCEQYFVYELRQPENPAPGSNVNALDPDKRSQPGSAVVPALGDNYSVGDDKTSGKKKISIHPVAPDTVYALLDADGNVVSQAGSDEKWKQPSGNPKTVEFTNLDPDTVYTVVAKPLTGNETPEDKKSTGSSVSIPAAEDESGDFYLLKLMNSAKAVSVTRDGQDVAVGDNDSEVLLKAGDIVSVDADELDQEGNPFLRWNVLIGNMKIEIPTRRDQPLTMPKGAVVLQATYEPSPAQNANASLDYAPKDGRFALNPEGDAIKNLKEKLIDNSDDRAVMADPNARLTYTVKFNKKTVTASVSDAVKEETGKEKLLFPWSMQIGLSRAVDGVNKARVSTASDAEVNVLTKVPEHFMDGTDYHLFKKSTTPAGGISLEEIPMEPNPNEADSGFKGVFRFSAQIGDTLVLSCRKAYTVTITDPKRNEVYKVKVGQGDGLSDAGTYRDVKARLQRTFTEQGSGLSYEFKGLKKTDSDSAAFYDETSAVTRDLKLYAFYALTDDSAWRAAREKLAKEIAKADALSQNGNVSREDRDQLAQGVQEATAVLNRNPRASTDELEAAYKRLKAIVDRITTGGQNPPPPPPAPHGGRGGGGGGGARSISASKGPGLRAPYQNGVDGNWDNFDSQKHGWAFVRTDGTRLKDQWADIVYTYGNVSRRSTYHFDENGVMDSGWYRDRKGAWYFLKTTHDGWYGELTKGWHYDATDGNWYYLNLLDGAMLTGWQKIDDSWYYLNAKAEKQTWFYDNATGNWEYGNEKTRPLGAMYANTHTPDGFFVDENGRWIRETP